MLQLVKITNKCNYCQTIQHHALRINHNSHCVPQDVILQILLHNGYIDVLLRYGLFAFLFYVLYWIFLAKKALFRIIENTLNHDIFISLSILTLGLIVIQFNATLFINWRVSLILGLLLGIASKDLNKKGKHPI